MRITVTRHIRGTFSFVTTVDSESEAIAACHQLDAVADGYKPRSGAPGGKTAASVPGKLNKAGRAALALLVANPLVPRKTLVDELGLLERSVSFLLEHGYIAWSPTTKLFTVLRNE